MVEVTITGKEFGENSLFQASCNYLAKQGLVIDDGIVEPDRIGHFTLPIQNHTTTPVNLAADEAIGMLAPAVIEKHHEDTRSPSTDIEQHIKAIKLGLNDQDRVKEIKSALKITNLSELTPNEMSELELIDEYVDIFALLGSTNIIQHTINTGDNQPLRQPPRRIPFSLRTKIEQMVAEMEEQGVVQPSD